MADKAKKKKGKSMSASGRILMIAIILTSLVFHATTIFLIIGMLPTIAARLTDRTPEKTKAMTVGFMNFAGCFPFWFDIIEKGHNFDSLLTVISSPLTIVIIYTTALLGYLIEWGVVGFIANMVAQKDKSKLTSIKKAQDDLVRKWGIEVTGVHPENDGKASINT